MMQFVKGVYAFSAEEPGEIPISPGDIIQVVDVIDDNWLRGSIRGNVGSFPKNFVQPLPICYEPGSGQKVFVATKQFVTGVDGDLSFNTGDVIVGLNQVDDNWWFGELLDTSGIFPLTHVEEVPLVAPSGGGQLNHVAPSTSNAQCVSSKENVGSEIALVRATLDLTAQLDEELSFISGDLIHVLEILDSDFGIGRCGDKTGMFPLSFVEVIEGSLNIESTSPVESQTRHKFDWFKSDTGVDEGCSEPPQNLPSSSDLPAVEALHAPTPDTGNQDDRTANNISSRDVSLENKLEHSPEVYTRENSSANAQGHLNACTQGHSGASTQGHSDASTQGHSGASTQERSSGSFTRENTMSFDTSIMPYGKTLYPFIAEKENELTFVDNEIVQLICHIDDQWIEGEIDGNIGIFPASYVEVIVDCPYASKHASDSVLVDPPIQETGKSSLSEGSGEVYGRVLFDFQASCQHDIDLKEGDTVTILHQADDHWFEAHHDDGRTGMVPISYVEVIEESLSASPLVSNEKPEFNIESLPETDNKNDSTLPADSSATLTTKIPLLKPALKPKPNVKPKPGLKPSGAGSDVSLSVRNPVRSLSQEQPQEVTVGPDAVSASRDRSESPTEIPLTDNAPRRSRAPARPSRSPQLQKKPVGDASLDDLIRSELISAKDQSSGKEIVTSVGSSEGEAKCGPTIIPPQRPKAPTLNELAASKMADGRSVGQSMFYHHSPPTTPADAKPQSAPRAKFPVTFSDEESDMVQLERQPSGKKRPAPPRPSGPRPAPVSSSIPLIPTPHPDDLTQSRVPQRPAPPRPSGGRPIDVTPVPAKRKKTRVSEVPDLLEFSPDKESPTSEVSEENRQIINDLDRRIREIDRDLETYEAAVNDLEQLLAADGGTLDDMAGGVTHNDTQENLAFYRANIHGLTTERQQLKASLYELEPQRAIKDEERKQRALRRRQMEEERRRQEVEEAELRAEQLAKRVEKRGHVIEEIVQTEKDYLFSLSLCADTFLNPAAEKCAAVDLDVVFGNMDEVIELSQRLLNCLEAATSGLEFSQQQIGSCFVSMNEEMKRVYAPYCKNHDEVLALLEKMEMEEPVQDYFNQMLEVMRGQIQVFDVGSILIKPVQRILKYPLLLNELIKCTEDDHIDKSHLVGAVTAMTDVASAINEFKRRKDLVMRYKKDKESSIADRFSKLNIHSTKKKLARLSQMVVGIQTIDQNFMVEERRFKALDNSVRNAVRDVSLYMEQLQDSVGCQESVAHDISDYYADQCQEQEVQQFCKVHNQVAARLFHAFKDAVEEKVIKPLNRLVHMFQGPTKVIKKRYDKLLDYDNLSKRSAKETGQSPQANTELQVVRQNYEALNAQLLDELPQLYQLSMVVLNDCLRHLLACQRDFYHAALEQMYQLLSLQLILASDDTAIVEPFNIAHTAMVDRFCNISFVTKAFNPAMEERRKSRAGSRRSTDTRTTTPPLSIQQSSSQQAHLRTLYQADKLYLVTDEPSSSLPMDLSVCVGSLVGVIKEGDPMGNKERWFVDNGVDRGFILKQCLTPSRAASVSGGGEKTIPADAAPSDSLMAFSPGESSLPAKVDWSLSEPPTVSKGPLPPTLKDSQSESSSLQAGGGSRLHSESQSPNPFPRGDSFDSLDDVLLPTFDEMGEFYQAVYAFEARNDLEVTLMEGDMVKVIQEHDLEGNKEWWLVESNGKQGYAPASYLYKVK